MKKNFCVSLNVVSVLVIAMGFSVPAGWCAMCGGGCGIASSGLSTFTTADFSGSGVCAACHDNLVDTAGANVSIAAHWRSTMMANSATDPLWQAKMSTEVARNPVLAQVIEEKCSRCHTPMARVQAGALSLPVGLLNSGFLNPGNALHKPAMDGVSCALCHQIQDINLGTAEGYSGHYVIDTGTASPYRVIFGQFAQPFANPMMMKSGFTPIPGDQIGDSALCGSCHTLYTPSRDALGNFTREFPEQMTYPEWQHAVNGGGPPATCADCHMPKAAGAASLSTMPMRLSTRTPFAMHHFAGGNNFMLGVLKANITALGVTATPAQLDSTMSRTSSLLGAKAAQLTFGNASVSNDVLGLSLKVVNRTGHKLPTGIPFRRAWIDLAVKDATGSVFFESGKPGADGSIQGCDADGAAGTCERHYELITNPSQVQIYESVMGDLAGSVTYTLLEAVSYLKDNRLLPAGFSKAAASDDIAVVGDARSDANFIGGQDIVQYKIYASGRPRPFTVTATLYYQGVSFAAVRDLRKTNTAQVGVFGAMYDAAAKTPVAIKAAQVTVN